MLCLVWLVLFFKIQGHNFLQWILPVKLHLDVRIWQSTQTKSICGIRFHCGNGRTGNFLFFPTGKLKNIASHQSFHL